MLEKFRSWYLRNYESITWFIIGFLVIGGLVDLSRGNITGAIISFGIALVNYIFVRKGY